MDLSRAETATSWRNVLWILVIVGASLGFSRAFACATPFVALAVLAGTQMTPRPATLAVLLAWVANQAIGFFLLGYPHTPTTFAWGAAIGIAALGALAVAVWMKALPVHSLARIVLAFVAAFATYEGLLYVAGILLSSEGSAFTLPIVMRILSVNAVAFAVLYALHLAASGVGLVEATPRRQPIGV